jgi:hypothetical protein
MALTPQERKRKEKELQKRQKMLARQPLAIDTDQFKKPRLAQVWLQTETAILEVYIATSKDISDQTVIAAIERLVRQMQAGPLPPLEVETHLAWKMGQEEDLIIENIRRRWVPLLEAENRPSKEDFIGVLRSILGTINLQKSPLPHSVGYLRYIGSFLEDKVGLKIRIEPAHTPLLEN